ncbi:hypothetical protein QUB63_13280 [Microcoleus sp. ARI1-B5]|uniref:hypothetical protein n=1 Tax=unclassified Microcoleus TaxID=2642155 RepID=UPI002FD3C38C
MKRSYPVGNRTFGKTGKRPIAFVGKLETSERISWVGWGRVYGDCLWVLKMVGDPPLQQLCKRYQLLTITYE